ncbi:serine/threonine-protein kinase [Nocardioides sp. LML1-1-1.1]|uniref:serine/threonine-protein kinase n=1 Tax=Nocardioides sp. LML1-1-1.1 TaxID=3135248 RepID=UPI0034220C45
MSLPERLGRLRRVDRIGAGGFATVWLYHDDELDSPVAVKALADNWAQRADVTERFLEEARFLRRADSDHVVRVYDIGEADGTPYFVMTYADRGTVADLVEPGRPAPGLARVVDLMAQAGGGVAELHRTGVIHRDIKPQNLLLRSAPDGGERVMVADLGVAKAMLHASGLTQVVGTPAYMAPEQANGLGLDLRADVHALGAVTYHLMTGRLVREGGIGSLAQPVLPPAPSEVAAVPSPFDAVVLRALAPDPEERWPDVPSFVAALRWAERRSVQDDAMTGTVERRAPLVVQATEAISVERPDDRPPTRPLRVVLLALLVLLLTFGAAYGVTRVVAGDEPGAAGGADGASTAADIDFPALRITKDQVYDPHVVRAGTQVWSYPVPAGWVAYDGENAAVDPATVDKRGQVWWRPEGEPLVGGHGLRVQARATAGSVQELVAVKADELRKSKDLKDVDVYEASDDAVYFTFRDSLGRLRYNFFRWVPNVTGAATLEISVTGRAADKAGLEALLDRVATGARTESR